MRIYFDTGVFIDYLSGRGNSAALLRTADRRGRTPADIAAKVPAAMGEANTFRVIFFILTFFSIGVLSNFRTLWQEGIGKLAAVYVISLFGFVIWVGLLISWLFFSGIHPPLAS